MKVSLRVMLPCTVSEAWAALHDPAVFTAVSKPFLRFRPLNPEEFPKAWSTGSTYVVEGLALGFIPLGHQEINPVTTESDTEKTFSDNGRGISGALGLVSSFRHRMTLRPSGVGPTELQDELEFDAGVLSPIFWLGFRMFWWWRHRVMKKLVSTWRSEAGLSWDERYTRKKWSGNPNASLVAAVSGLTPGTALDLGCGEGADALWLAEQGFEVTALDASPLALARGEEHRRAQVTRDHQPRIIRWIAQDVITEPLPESPTGFDLITASFFHVPATERKRVWKKMVAALARGGTLVIIGHAIEEATSGVHGPPQHLRFDHAELRGAIPKSWSSVKVEQRTREQRGSDGAVHTVTDTVLVAQR